MESDVLGARAAGLAALHVDRGGSPDGDTIVRLDEVIERLG